LETQSIDSRPGLSCNLCTGVALLAALLVFAWTAARIHYDCAGNWTAVFRTGAIFRVPPDLDAGTYRFEAAGYDGQFYRYLAHDPFLRNGYANYVDAPQMRFRRMLVPMAAWLFALGQSRWIDDGYIAVEMIFLALGVYWCARLLARRGRSPAWGLLFVVVPATLASFDRMLVDGPLTALFAGFLLYCEEERWTRVWILAMLAALTRETGLLLGAALLLDRLWQRDWRGAAWFASVGIPAGAWYGYLALRLPHDGPVPIFAIPGWGILRRLFFLRTYPDPNVQLLLRITDLLAVAGLSICIILAARWLRHRSPDPVTLCVSLYAVLTLVLGEPSHMLDAFGFGRPASPLLLWIMLEAVYNKSWAALMPPLLVSLSVSLALTRPFVTVVLGLAGH
jgi:hypothetical protein